MTEQENKNPPEQEPVDKASDKEIVDLLIGHIDQPCEVNVGQEVHNIREFYLKEAERFLGEDIKERLTDPVQIERLRKKVEEYRS